MMLLNHPDAVLCYVEDIRGEMFRAHFTTRALADQWGDDWDDAPYEHNAGLPYEPFDRDKEAGTHWELTSVDFRHAVLVTPATEVCNSAYSVKDINGGAAPWLSPSQYLDEVRKPDAVLIAAGITLRDFVGVIYATGGALVIDCPLKLIGFKKDAPR